MKWVLKVVELKEKDSEKRHLVKASCLLLPALVVKTKLIYSFFFFLRF